MRTSTVLGLLVVGIVLAGCGNDAGSTATPAAHAYDGPLFESRDQATYPRAGAAGDVVDCRYFGRGGFDDSAEYGEGATADSADGALSVARSEAIFEGQQDGLQIAARTGDRVLYVLEADGVVKQAVIVHDGPAPEGAGGPGWYVESWARCDWSEMPASVIDPLGIQIWTDRHGQPLPVRRVQSYLGPEHCDWQSMTFLQIGPEIGGDTYVRHPSADVADFFDQPYRAHVALPGDATATGIQREGKRLWLAADGGTAYVGSDPADVEAWPREARPLGCA